MSARPKAFPLVPAVGALPALLVLLALPARAEEQGRWLEVAQEQLVGGQAGLPLELSRTVGPPLTTRGLAEARRAAREAGLLPLEEGVGGAGLPEERRGPKGLGYTPLPSRPFEEPYVLLAGGGAHLYTGELGRLTNFAGVQLALGLELRPLAGVGVELGYELSWVGLDPNLSPTGVLWRHSLGGLVKVGPALFGQTVRPFLGAGAGLALFNPNEAAETWLQNDRVLEVPLAFGLEWQLGPVTMGVRGVYRFLFDEQLLRTPPPAGGVRGGSLGGAALAGGRF